MARWDLVKLAIWARAPARSGGVPEEGYCSEHSLIILGQVVGQGAGSVGIVAWHDGSHGFAVTVGSGTAMPAEPEVVDRLVAGIPHTSNDYRAWLFAACRKGSLINGGVVVESFFPHEYADSLSAMPFLLLALPLVDRRLQLNRLKFQHVRLPSVDRRCSSICWRCSSS